MSDLKAELAALEAERYRLEMSDDFCYSNGKVDWLLTEIARVRHQLQAEPPP